MLKSPLEQHLKRDAPVSIAPSAIVSQCAHQQYATRIVFIFASQTGALHHSIKE